MRRSLMETSHPAVNMNVKPKLDDPRLNALFEYWDGKRANRPYPDRSDIDPIEMKPWLGHLMLVDRTPGGDYIYRLYGSAFVDEFKLDMTGQSINGLPPERRDLIRAEYDSVAIPGIPASRQYTAMFEYSSRDGRSTWKVQRSWERLVLPLSAGSSDVGVLLVGAYPLDEGDELPA